MSKSSRIVNPTVDCYARDLIRVNVQSFFIYALSPSPSSVPSFSCFVSAANLPRAFRGNRIGEKLRVCLYIRGDIGFNNALPC